MSETRGGAYFQTQFSEKRSQIADKWLISASAIAVLVSFQLLYRATIIGFNFTTFLQLALMSSVWLVTLFRKRIPFGVRAIYLGSAATLSGLAGVWNLGLFGTGLNIIAIAAPVMCLFFNLRVALIFLVVQTIIASGIATHHVQYKILPDFDYISYLQSPTIWVLQISSFVFVAILLTLSSSALLNYFTSALEEASIKTRQLAQSESENRRILDQIITPYIRFNNDGVFVLVSKSAKNIFGIPSQKLLGTKILDYVANPHELSGFLANVEQAPTDLHELELNIPQKVGPQLIVALHVQNWSSEEGLSLGAEGTMLDVTKQRAAQKSLFHSRKLRASGLMAAGISHDFNNNLTVILGCLDAIEENSDNESETQKLVEIARRSGEKAVHLSRRLQKVSPRDETNTGSVDINGTIAAFMPILARVVPNNIQVRFNESPECPSIDIDPSALEDLVFNLVTNARDAMPKGGQVNIKTQVVEIGALQAAYWPEAERGKYIMLSVVDSGHGISEIDKTRIFEPFYSSKNPDNGTGLGLSLVEGFVTASNGFIRVKSAIGKGSSFEILLPCIPPNSEPNSATT